MRIRKKRATAAEKAQAELEALRQRGTQVGDWLMPAVGNAAEVARQKAGPAAAAARDKVMPVAIAAKDTAVEKLTPAVESARDKFVDELLPRLAEVAAAAATAAAAARDNAVEGAAHKAQQLADEAVEKLPSTKKRKRRRRFAFLLVAGAAAAAGAAAWRARSKPDPWDSVIPTGPVDLAPISKEGDTFAAVIADEPLVPSVDSEENDMTPKPTPSRRSRAKTNSSSTDETTTDSPATGSTPTSNES